MMMGDDIDDEDIDEDDDADDIDDILWNLNDDYILISLNNNN